NIKSKLSLGYSTIPLTTIIIPLLLLAEEKIFDKKLFINLIKIINIIVYIVIFFGIIDMLTNYRMNIILRDFIKLDSLRSTMEWMSSFGTYRLYNILGHPLVNMQIFIIYFVLNIIAIKYLNFQSNILKVVIIFFVGTILTGSKMGLVISIFSIAFYGLKNKNKFLQGSIICFSIVIIVFISQTNYFEKNIKSRFITAIQSGDITNGRFGAIETVFENSDYRPKLLYGGGYDYSRIVTDKNRINNFEFPVLMWGYDYGIIVAVLLVLISIIYPLIKLIRFKAYDVIFLYILLQLYCQSFNGLIYGDNFARLIFCNYTIIKIIGNYKKNRC
ncbi:hypothetical protein, partial [Clostridium perfringens]|uniref:hypothetical protein n=1 Tax=Clostridium perfringens TaxID=1502 RepID=UPI00186AEC47